MITKNADLDTYKNRGYGVGFGTRSEISYADGSLEENDTIFWADTSSSMHIDNKNKDILFLREWSTWGLDDTTLTAEAEYSIIFTWSGKRFVLGPHYNGSNSVFINATKIYQFKATDSKIKYYSLFLGDFSKKFTIDNMKKNRIKRKFKCFFCWF